MQNKGQHLGVQQILVLFLVGSNPGIMRSQVRKRFGEHGMAIDGIDRRLRELDKKGLLIRSKQPEGASLRLSKNGKEEFDRLAPAFRGSLITPKKAKA